jgi:murein DD-endopeptidase MepM/ murein hydrolase activator NlpD
MLAVMSCSAKKQSTTKKSIYQTSKKNIRADQCISNYKHLTNKLHVIQKGENLYKLSKIYNVSIDDLISANDIEDPTNIKIGKIILIPGVYNTNFQWPTIGNITSYYGNRRRNFHTGIDISAKKGADITSISDGVVITSGNSIDGYRKYGRIIVIDHGNGIQSLYAHNKKNYVKEGQCVKKGDKIGEIGSSGNATGSHVHLEIIKDGKTINPLKYLNEEDGFDRP